MTYTVPAHPADAEHAALELIVRAPAEIHHTDAFTEVLQDYCGLLDAENVFAGLCWHDARHVATAIAFDVTHRGDDAAAEMRNRARNILARVDDGIHWGDRQGVVRALNIAAAVLDEL